MEESYELPDILGVEAATLLKPEWWSLFEVTNLEDFLVPHMATMEEPGENEVGKDDAAEEGGEREEVEGSIDHKDGENEERPLAQANVEKKSGTQEESEYKVQPEETNDGEKRRGLKRRRSV